MLVRIHAPLSAPPSCSTIFRDTTLFAKTFCNLDVVLECEKGTRSYYWNWLKNRGAADFVDDLVREGEVSGYYIGPKNANVRVNRLNYQNHTFVINALYSLKS